MSVFPTHEREFFRNAAIHAAHELGLFAALAAPRTVDDAARALAVDARRLRTLADYLIFEGVLARRGDCCVAEKIAPRPAAPPPQSWGRLAEVVRAGRPVDEPQDPARFHQHLLAAGAEAARAFAARVRDFLDGGGSLLDAGGGAGGHIAAALAVAPGARASLVDRAEVLAIARTALGARAENVQFVDGDLLHAATSYGAGHAVGLLANVLHLYAPDDCARLIARVAAAVAPGGVVAVQEVFVEPDRSGPAGGLLFALNMALYTDGGDAWDAATVARWLEAAGLAPPTIERITPDAVLLLARKPEPRT